MRNIERIKFEFSRTWFWPFRERITKYLVKSGNYKNYKKGITIAFDGLLFYFDTRNYIEYKLYAEGYYEKEIALLMKNYVQEGDIVLDIGANIGVHSLNLSKWVGKNGTVYSFEPIPFLREKMTLNLQLNAVKNVHIIPKALSDSSYTLKTSFSETANNGTFYIAHDAQGLTEITCINGDDWVNETQLTHIKLIKIDVEGFEMKVLKGLKNTLQKFEPILFFEYDSQYIARAQSTADDFTAFFRDLNYCLFIIEKYRLIPITDFNGLEGMKEILALPLALCLHKAKQ